MGENTDYSVGYNDLRLRLMAESGNDYRNVIAGLHPDYKRVWLDIGLGYACLALTLYLVALVPHTLWLIPALPLGAITIGYWIAYIQLFIHEAAHFNLARDRKVNDRLCNALIGWQVGTAIADYRRVHFDHHRKLGRTDDSERSYFNALTWRFIFLMLTGIHAIKVFLLRKTLAVPDDEGRPQKSLRPLAVGVLVHMIVIMALIVMGAWPSAMAWILGVGVFFPFFATIRQLLEHRSTDADAAIDYAQMPHGALTRLFGDDILSRTFGGAGFNRHLLHHWEPQISYTRLKDFENYLITTSAAPLIIHARRGGYIKTFMDLLRNDNAKRGIPN